MKLVVVAARSIYARKIVILAEVLTLFRLTSRSPLTSVVSITLAACFAAPALSVPITEPELEAGLHEYEQAIKAVSVQSRVEGFTEQFGKTPEPAIQRNLIETITVESLGRARCEIEGKQKDGTSRAGAIQDVTFVGTFNGDECRFGRGFTKILYGLVTPQRSDLGWTLDPREFLTHYGGTPISHLLAEGKTQITGTAIYEGRELVVLETFPVRNGPNWKSMFLIDPIRSFIVPKRARLVQFPGSERWIEYTRISCFDYEEAVSGIWLPSRVVSESFDPTAEHARTGAVPPVSWKWEIRNSNWIVNPVISDSLFTLEFPLGIEVEDKVRGRIYKTTAISDDGLDAQAQRALDWSGIHSSHWKVVLLAANVIIIAFIVALLLWRKQRA